MAGGIFPGRPFEPNIKCIIFSLVLAAGYWYLPPKSLWILVFLLWFPYIVLAWYDWSYGCQNKIGPSPVPFGRYIWVPFKPKGYQEEVKNLSPEQKALWDRVDHVAGWSIIVAALGYYLLRKK